MRNIHVSAAVASLTVWMSWISVPALGVARTGVSTGATVLAVVGGVVAVVGRPHRPVLVSAGTGEVGPVTILTGTGQKGPLRFLGLVTWLTPRCAWGRSGGWGLGTPSTLRRVTTSWFGGFKGSAVGMAALPGSPRFLRSFGEGSACDTSGPHTMTARCGDVIIASCVRWWHTKHTSVPDICRQSDRQVRDYRCGGRHLKVWDVLIRSRNCDSTSVEPPSQFQAIYTLHTHLYGYYSTYGHVMKIGANMCSEHTTNPWKAPQP